MRVNPDAVLVRLVDDRVVDFVRHRGIRSASIAQPDLDVRDVLGGDVLHGGARLGRTNDFVVGVQRPGPLDQDRVRTAVGRHDPGVEPILGGRRKIPGCLVHLELQRQRHGRGAAVVGGADTVERFTLEVVQQVLRREVLRKRFALGLGESLVSEVDVR